MGGRSPTKYFYGRSYTLESSWDTSGKDVLVKVKKEVNDWNHSRRNYGSWAFYEKTDKGYNVWRTGLLTRDIKAQEKDLKHTIGEIFNNIPDRFGRKKAMNPLEKARMTWMRKHDPKKK